MAADASEQRVFQGHSDTGFISEQGQNSKCVCTKNRASKYTKQKAIDKLTIKVRDSNTILSVTDIGRKSEKP